ncbi:hypothetical protein CPB83DRAFT_849444 [Crepidotus variabilis]|uniref:Uncharacterized protein n=1 Tax=Crepidotus variabilis TaxID=179855 RepID=A0A9P6EK02_9AGAR|nr:hypothetical protein CPB83DRAFT_849444 [Crepidotus variabilis]
MDIIGTSGSLVIKSAHPRPSILRLAYLPAPRLTGYPLPQALIADGLGHLSVEKYQRLCRVSNLPIKDIDEPDIQGKLGIISSISACDEPFHCPGIISLDSPSFPLKVRNLSGSAHKTLEERATERSFWADKAREIGQVMEEETAFVTERANSRIGSPIVVKHPEERN